MGLIIFIIVTIIAIFVYKLLHQMFEIRYFSFKAMFAQFVSVWLAVYIALFFIFAIIGEIFSFLFGWLV